MANHLERVTSLAEELGRSKLNAGAPMLEIHVELSLVVP